MIYVTGDMHGDYRIFSQKKFKNIKEGDTLIVCGDFGFIWNGDLKEKKFLDKLARKKYNICFVDGTHENFDLLSQYPVTTFAGGKAHKIRDNIFHLMRGQVFEIEGEHIFAMGGGESPDKDLRYGNDNWSDAEIPTREEMREGATNLEKYKFKVDYVITHEPAQKIKNFLRLKDNEPMLVSGLNAYFQELSTSCDYTRWFFGSLHEDKFVSASQIAVFRNLINIRTGELVE
ncbi:MAG: metallophosphoesterase [Clostridia bacterium]|nr:metallophosphoesterase [Clostridia bacterium]